MNELIKYIKDARFYAPVTFLVLLELFLQSGLYKHFLQPRSYADNINTIIRKVGRSNLKPEVLILGTSVAYQGINVRLLNRLLEKERITVQSAACEGARLITQHLIYKQLRKELPELRVILHVSEVSFPWTARFGIDDPNMSMIAQLPRSLSLPLLDRYDTHLTSRNRMVLFVRMLTYQKDIRDAVLDPLDRVKGIGRRFREPHSDYVYENKYTYRLSSYPARDLKECIRAADRGVPEIDSHGKRITDNHHRRAVRITCQVGMNDPIRAIGAIQWNRLFFKRLKIMYDEIEADGLTTITAFAPYSDLITDMNADRRRDVWDKNLKKLYPGRRRTILDLRRSLDGPDNGDLYYDTIHLNRAGADRFTRILAEKLITLPEIRHLRDRHK